MLKQTISQDLKEAMKAGDSFRAGVLRMILSAFKNKEIENKGKGKEAELSEEEIIEILFKEAKKRKEASEAYANAGRGELANKEAKELEMIKNYLPEQLGEEEIEAIVAKIIEKIGADGEKDPEGKPWASYGARFSRVMAEAMKELKGKAESSLVAGIIKKKISGLAG